MSKFFTAGYWMNNKVAKPMGMAFLAAIVLGFALPGNARSVRMPLGGGAFRSVVGSDLINAKCVKTSAPSDREMLDWLAAYGAGERNRASVTSNGVSFIDESPKLVALFSEITSYRGFRRSFSEARSFRSSCSSVVCAAQDIFGHRVGLQLLYLLARYHFNGSHYSFDDASEWDSSELEDVLIALALYPDFSSVRFGHKLIHYPRDPSWENGRQLGDGSIGFFNEWTNMSRSDRVTSAGHEIAHVLAIALAPQQGSRLDSTDEWLSLSGWSHESLVMVPTQYSVDHPSELLRNLTHPERVTSVYGLQSPREDFAESVILYRLAPQRFISIDSAAGGGKYDYIKKYVFKGVEYLRAGGCNSEVVQDTRAPVAEGESTNIPLSSAPQVLDNTVDPALDSTQAPVVESEPEPDSVTGNVSVSSSPPVPVAKPGYSEKKEDKQVFDYLMDGIWEVGNWFSDVTR